MLVVMVDMWKQADTIVQLPQDGKCRIEEGLISDKVSNDYEYRKNYQHPHTASSYFRKEDYFLVDFQMGFVEFRRYLNIVNSSMQQVFLFKF